MLQAGGASNYVENAKADVTAAQGANGSSNNSDQATGCLNVLSMIVLCGIKDPVWKRRATLLLMAIQVGRKQNEDCVFFFASFCGPVGVTRKKTKQSTPRARVE